MIFVLRTKILKKREKTTVIKNSKKDDLREKKQRCARTLYPWQPHMHVCLFNVSALFCCFTSPRTRTQANLSVCRPQAYVHLWGWEGRGQRWEGEQWEGARRSSPQSLHPSPVLPPLWELRKESLSPASQLQSSSVQLCQSLCVQYI